jgi:hypothetical protein
LDEASQPAEEVASGGDHAVHPTGIPNDFSMMNEYTKNKNVLLDKL